MLKLAALLLSLAGCAAEPGPTIPLRQEHMDALEMSATWWNDHTFSTHNAFCWQASNVLARCVVGGRGWEVWLEGGLVDPDYGTTVRGIVSHRAQLMRLDPSVAGWSLRPLTAHEMGHMVFSDGHGGGPNRGHTYSGVMALGGPLEWNDEVQAYCRMRRACP